jgi:hypothetical protein
MYRYAALYLNHVLEAAGAVVLFVFLQDYIRYVLRQYG